MAQQTSSGTPVLALRRRSFTVLMLGAGVLVTLLAGCDQPHRAAVVRQPVPNPTPAPISQPSQVEQPRAKVTEVQIQPGPAQEPVISPVERLARDVEATFAAGENEYKNGNLSVARQQFDRSLDMLMQSGLDIQGDQRLSDLFDKIVSEVNSAELIASREGDGTGEQKSAPAPIDEIATTVAPDDGAPTAPVDVRLRPRAEAELKEVSHDLPLTVNDAVLSFLNYFQTPRGTAIVEAGMRRSGRYREMIERVLTEEGLPTDLIHLAQAESAFQPQALSRAGARGLWQFMAYRGSEYGLERTWWLDERQDPEPATRAAARHLRDLYGIFGDWYLAMAAYNSGPGAVQKAIERTGYADFWELYNRNVLPKETRSYVPIILALTLIAKDPQRYGIQVQPDPPVPTDNVQPGHPIDLRLVAETIETDVDTLRGLNPELLRLVTPPTPDFVLRLPEGTAERFAAEIAPIPPDKWVSWRQHRVADGETISGIAKQYHVTPAAIANANGLDAKAELPVGQKLIIPAAQPQPTAGTLVRYTVRRGDTLVSIGDEFGVTAAELRRWNGLKATTTQVNRGVRLRIYPGGMGPQPGSTTARASKPGATSSSKPVAAVAAASSKVPAPTVPKPVAETEVAMVSSGGGNSSPVVHRVQPGETLWSIAKTYSTTVEALRGTNPFLLNRGLQAGDSLKIGPAN
jgi:membrane-bound lytic murein transglycosylase D